MKNLKDSQGRYLTLALFVELNTDSKYPPIYTLTPEAKENIPSAYQIYINADTEYHAAIELVGSWTHWKKLLNCKPFFEYVEEWRKEREEKWASIGIAELVKQAKGGNAMAARWLAEKGFKDKTKPIKTSDKDIQMNRMLSEVDKDYERMMTRQ